VLENREFRALWLAEVLSVGGDQPARVAVLVLVYQRTSLVSWAALTYALTYLPTLVGGLPLAGLADRHRRRELIVVTDVCRAVLAGVMACPVAGVGWRVDLAYDGARAVQSHGLKLENRQ